MAQFFIDRPVFATGTHRVYPSQEPVQEGGSVVLGRDEAELLTPA